MNQGGIDLWQFPHLMMFNGLGGIFMVKQDIAFFAFSGFMRDSFVDLLRRHDWACFSLMAFLTAGSSSR